MDKVVLIGSGHSSDFSSETANLVLGKLFDRLDSLQVREAILFLPVRPSRSLTS